LSLFAAVESSAAHRVAPLCAVLGDSNRSRAGHAPMIDFSRNHFELFGLEPRFRFDIAALDRAYRDLQSDVHPDRHAAASDDEQRIALQSSARVNEAYRTLKDPVARAEYLLSLHGVDAAIDGRGALGVDFLEQQLERREQASDAADAEDVATLDALLGRVRAELREREDALAEQLDGAGAWAQAAARVRELRFLAKVAEDIGAMIAALED
jgi:molecular chaperone HscB